MSLDIIATPRGGGKTEALIRWFLEDPDNRGILVHSGAYAGYLWVTIQERAEDRFIPASAVQVFGRRLHGTRRTWAIDNLDVCLQNYVPQVGPVTVNVDLDGEGEGPA